MSDVTYYIKDGCLYKSVENDGWSYVRHGPQTQEYCLCTVEEAETRYPDKLARAKGDWKNAVHKISPSV